MRPATPWILAVALMLARPAIAQFTGQRVTLDRRYPTDTKVPSKYGTQVVGKEGAQFLAGIRCLSSLPL